MVGDLAGFAASIVRRGMNLIQIPTSLLAQADSSVGGKTGINTIHGKNLVGTFHQPVKVIVDIAVLETLPEREFRGWICGNCQIWAHQQSGFFAWLEAQKNAIFNLEDAVGKAIAESCRAKATIVASDECEKGQRALLNLGHTFGHALEAACEYDRERLIHGEGVSIGMVLAHQFSNWLNICDENTVKKVQTPFGPIRSPCAHVGNSRDPATSRKNT